MYRKRKEYIKKFVQRLLWWHPVALLLIMFALGACSVNTSETAVSSSETPAASETRTALAAEAVSEPQTVSEDTEASGPKGSSESEEISENEAWSEAYSGLKESESITPTELYTGSGNTVIKEDGNYTSKEEVALYIHTYGKLPSNYITKKHAAELGWDSGKGNLDSILPGMSIGGSTFGNYEEKLPKAAGRKYFECDIDYEGGYRNTKRLVYSNDGLIYYTEDHYNSFEQLY